MTSDLIGMNDAAGDEQQGYCKISNTCRTGGVIVSTRFVRDSYLLSTSLISLQMQSLSRARSSLTVYGGTLYSGSWTFDVASLRPSYYACSMRPPAALCESSTSACTRNSSKARAEDNECPVLHDAPSLWLGGELVGPMTFVPLHLQNWTEFRLT